MAAGPARPAFTSPWKQRLKPIFFEHFKLSVSVFRSKAMNGSISAKAFDNLVPITERIIQLTPRISLRTIPEKHLETGPIRPNSRSVFYNLPDGHSALESKSLVAFEQKLAYSTVVSTKQDRSIALRGSKEF